MAERGREGWLGYVMTGTLDSEDGFNGSLSFGL